MRHATWQRLEASPLWHGVYRKYRRLPDGFRAPLRALLTPRWQLATHIVRAASRRRVVAGPFSGMALQLSPLSQRHLLGYILGSQELELRSVIERIIARGYKTIFNVGAADGYYAVGLAMRLPDVRVEAFEALPELHSVIERTARANKVAERITIAGQCEVANLRRSLGAAISPTLVFMDIEGGEIKLLDPIAVPELRGADICVESHDMFVTGCTETLMERFRDTHDVERYTARPRTLADFPADFLPTLRRCFPRLAIDMMDERRIGVQEWLYLSARGVH